MKEQLLIDYLEESETELRELTLKLNKMSKEYQDSYGRDIRDEIDTIRKEIRKKRHEITERLYESMEEFRYLKRYFPELLEVFLEDEHLGKTLAKKVWLLDYMPMKREDASAELSAIRKERSDLRAARMELAKKGREIVSKHFIEQHPMLKGRVKPGASRDMTEDAIAELDQELRQKGWVVLLQPSFIEAPANRILGRIQMASAEERMRMDAVDEAKDKGSVAEHNARKRLQTAAKTRKRLERKLSHLLLSNPDYLKDLKKSKGWDRGKANPLKEFAKTVKMKTVKEKPWLEKMGKKLS